MSRVGFVNLEILAIFLKSLLILIIFNNGVCDLIKKRLHAFNGKEKFIEKNDALKNAEMLENLNRFLDQTKHYQ